MYVRVAKYHRDTPTSNDQGRKTSSEEDKAKCCTKT